MEPQMTTEGQINPEKEEKNIEALNFPALNYITKLQ